MINVLSKEDKVQVALGVKVPCEECGKLTEKRKIFRLIGPHYVCRSCAVKLTTGYGPGQ